MVDLARLRRLAGLGDDDDPLERLRKLRERRRLGLAPIPGGLSTEEAATRLNLPTGDEPPYLPALASRTGSFIKRNTMDLLEMITTPRGPAAMTGSPLRGIAEEAEQEFQRREEELARASIDLPTPVAGAGAFASNVAGLLLDPVELIPGGLLARGITSGARRGTRALTGAGRAAGEAVDLALKDVAREAAGGPRPSQFKWEGLVPQETPPALSEAPVARSTALGVSAEVEKNMYLRKAKLLWEWEGATKKRKAEIAKELDMFRGMLSDVYDVPVSGAAGDNIGMNLRSTERAKDSLARAVNPVADTAHKLILNQIDQLIEIEKTKGSAAQILRNLESVKRGMASGEIGAEDAAKMLETLQGRIKQAQDPHLGTLAQATEEMKAKPRPSRAEEFRQAVEALSPSPKQPVLEVNPLPGGSGGPGELPVLAKLRQYLSSTGVVPVEMSQRMTRAITEAQAEVRGAAYRAQDYGRILRGWVSSAKPSPKIEKSFQVAVDKAIRTNVPQEAVRLLTDAGVDSKTAGAMAEQLIGMRSHVDNLSHVMGSEELGLVNDSLREIIFGNEGEYVMRSYEAFTNPRHIDKLEGTTWLRRLLGMPTNPTPEWNAMKTWVMETNPELTVTEVEGLMRKLADKDPAKAFEAFRTNAFPRKNLGELKARMDLPKVYREFLGEIKDPVVNYMETVTRLSHDISVHKMLKEVREMGMGKVFFEVPTGRATVEVPGALSSRNPLVGSTGRPLYATAEMAEAIGGVERGLPAAIETVNAFYKIMATAGNEITHVRNFVAWPVLAIARGRNPLAMIRTGGAGFLDAIEMLRDPKGRKAIEFMLRSGVEMQGANAGEALAYAKRLQKTFGGEGANTFIKRSTRPVVNPLKRAGKKVLQAYTGEDSFWKKGIFDAEMKDYLKAYPDASREEVGRMVANIVNDTTPTSTRNPLAVKLARKFPATAPFVSFFAEIPRNVMNIGILAVKEMRSGNPVLQRLGAQRAAGLMTSVAAPAAPVVFFRMMNKTGPEEESALQALLPIRSQTEIAAAHMGYPWQRHSQVAITDMSGDYVSYVDMSFMDPLAVLKRPVMALLTDGPTEGTIEAFRPFLDTELFVGSLLDVFNNQRYSVAPWERDLSQGMGGKIYAENDPGLTKLGKSVAHIGSGALPGTFRQIERMYEGFTGQGDRKLFDEALSLSGIRVTRINVPKQTQTRARNWFEWYKEDRGSLKRARRNVERYGPQNVLEQEREMKKKFNRAWPSLQEVVNNARRLRFDDKRIKQALMDAGLGEEKARRIIRNQPWDPLEE